MGSDYPAVDDEDVKNFQENDSSEEYTGNKKRK
jgi:hypothetical protein